ncbi:MAG: hypothetical protein JWP63_5262 [Candidatus Solibacter sp.]|nr:hypothetical protein [Candidatus Solibacter sp.]
METIEAANVTRALASEGAVSFGDHRSLTVAALIGGWLLVGFRGGTCSELGGAELTGDKKRSPVPLEAEESSCGKR